MKTFAFVRYAAVALLAGAPLFAHAANPDAVQLCMDKFAAENFSDRTTEFKREDRGDMTLPLSVRGGTLHVRLTASHGSSGQVLATASCNVRNQVVTLSDVIVATAVSQR
jgi:hypothetical protein